MNKITSRIVSLILACVLLLGSFINGRAIAKSNSMQTSGGGMWISPGEIMRLPTSGSAWDKMRSVAYGKWGTADLTNQDNKHAINTLAGALVYARTGDSTLRSKVRDAILAAKRTLDQPAEWQTANGVLAAGRQLGAYVISADLISLKNYDTAADNEFRSWLTAVRTTNIGTHGRWKAISYTCENSAANWGTFACASRIAASIYLGDTADVNRAASIIRAFLGERSAYPANAPGVSGYFEHTSGYEASWACNTSLWTGINPACVKSGINLDGLLIEDASRGGACCTLKGDGIMYSWEALQGLFVSSELLYRTGAYDNPYSWSNQALKRSMDLMQRSGWGISNVATYVPWMANSRYGTKYPTEKSASGRIMSWGEWLYAQSTPPPPTATAISGLPTNTPAALTTYDDMNSVFIYTGTWENMTISGSYNGTLKISKSPGQSVTMTFTGTSVSIIYAKDTILATMNVYVNGILAGQINQQAASRQLQQVWTLPVNLQRGTYTLKLVNAGTNTNSYVSFDAVRVYP